MGELHGKWIVFSTKLLPKIEFQGCWVTQRGRGKGWRGTHHSLCYQMNDAPWNCEMKCGPSPTSLNQCILGGQWPWFCNSTASLACRPLSLSCDHQIRCQSPIRGSFIWLQNGKIGSQFSFLLNILIYVHVYEKRYTPNSGYLQMEGLWKLLFSSLIFYNATCHFIIRKN